MAPVALANKPGCLTYCIVSFSWLCGKQIMQVCLFGAMWLSYLWVLPQTTCPLQNRCWAAPVSISVDGFEAIFHSRKSIHVILSSFIQSNGRLLQLFTTFLFFGSRCFRHKVFLNIMINFRSLTWVWLSIPFYFPLKV